jgi:hypothetical protein
MKVVSKSLHNVSFRVGLLGSDIVQPMLIKLLEAFLETSF